TCRSLSSSSMFDTYKHSAIELVSLVFFFQAEDGIRDRNVTGVQTCALPISAVPARTACATASRPSGHRCCWDRPQRCRSSCTPRSEERRVGKECRSRWAQEKARKETRESR